MGIRLSGLVSGMDTESLVSELVSAYEYKKEQVEKEQTKLEWTSDSWKEMNTSIYSYYTGSLSSMRYQSTLLNLKSTEVSDSTKASVSANANVVNGIQSLEISSIAKASYLTGNTLSSGYSTSSVLVDDLGLTEGSIELQDSEGASMGSINITSTTTISDLTSQLSTLGLTASYDTTYNRFFVSSKSTGESSNFNFVVDDTTKLNNLAKLGLATAANYTDLSQTVPDDTATYKDGSNCIFKLNGATFETATNTNTINGLTITAKEVTDGEVTISTETDTDAMYDKIKKFFSDYNTLINSMTASYNADSSSGYEPLTDEEKEAMTDDQIETWETKIKDSLLRRDSTLSAVMSVMTSAMGQVFNIDGDNDGTEESYTLSSFGISTAGYFVAADNEEYAYHINGDTDDSVSGTNTDSLKAAISSNPELVSKFFSKVSTAVYDALTKKMASTSMSSAYTVYNDKQLSTQIDAKEDEVDEWEDKVSYYEDYWYDKFTAMETALSTLNSQQSALSSLLSS